MKMMLLNINKVIKPVQDAHLLEAVRPTLPHFTDLKMIHSIGKLSQKLMTIRTTRGIQLTVADPPHTSLCLNGTCFWQKDTRLREEGWAGGSHASHSKLYQRLHVFSLGNQNPSQYPCKASESMSVLKRNKWTKWALLLVMSAFVALGRRWFPGVSKAIPSFS